MPPARYPGRLFATKMAAWETQDVDWTAEEAAAADGSAPEEQEQEPVAELVLHLANNKFQREQLFQGGRAAARAPAVALPAPWAAGAAGWGSGARRVRRRLTSRALPDAHAGTCAQGARLLGSPPQKTATCSRRPRVACARSGMGVLMPCLALRSRQARRSSAATARRPWCRRGLWSGVGGMAKPLMVRGRRAQRRWQRCITTGPRTAPLLCRRPGWLPAMPRHFRGRALCERHSLSS